MTDTSNAGDEDRDEARASAGRARPWRTMPHPWAGDTVRRFVSELPGLIAKAGPAAAGLCDLLAEAEGVAAFDAKIEALRDAVGKAMKADDFQTAYALLDSAENAWADGAHPELVQLRTLVTFMDTRDYVSGVQIPSLSSSPPATTEPT